MSDPNAPYPHDSNAGGQPQPPQSPYQQPAQSGYQQPAQSAYQQQPAQSPYQQPAQSASAGPPLTEVEDRQWASFAHLGGILSFLPALIIWLVFKDRGRFTDEEGKEALNFQITLFIAYVAIWIVTAIITVVTFGLGAIVSVVAWLVWIAGVVFSILGFLKAKDGQHYRYPFALRLIK